MEGATPLDDLREKLEDVGLPAGVSIIDGPTSQIKAPAVVLRPDEPWIVPSHMCVDEQRYLAIVVVVASSPRDGVRKMYAVVKAIKNALTEAWSWESVSVPLIDQSTGTAFLACSVRLKYLNSEE